jgi:hypothetical protein
MKAPFLDSGSSGKAPKSALKQFRQVRLPWDTSDKTVFQYGIATTKTERADTRAPSKKTI